MDSRRRAHDVPRPNREGFGVFYPITPRWNDNDQYGHINNVIYYEYFDTAVNGWLTDQCGRVTDLDALGVVAETGCRYLNSASFPEPLEVGMAVLRLGRSSVTYQLAVFPRGGHQPHVVGHFVHVYVDPHSRRPTEVPARVAAAVGTLLATDLSVHELASR
ncbi:4-hydroxybenzoyl-CoA thioesterase [Nocardioides gansuensis]|uniref:4-hydroxybenzoyl-CoA thioesterase n=1 Tax=Nocardioides gansuensis TaxID=2138300 RepID=A0A2T8F7W7_9ACTN|nr:4-hydroxybenzoyl-CoA thioesterase [Nocardioides gansuensis]